MKTVLIFNIVALSVAVIFCTVCIIGWFRAESKLAEHGESVLFDGEEDK